MSANAPAQVLSFVPEWFQLESCPANSPLTAEFGESGDAGPAAMRCLRKKDSLRQRHELMTFFGPVCSEDCDLAAYQDPAYQVLPESPSPSFQYARVARRCATRPEPLAALIDPAQIPFSSGQKPATSDGMSGHHASESKCDEYRLLVCVVR